jgi:radical SAM superfamily enzyme YgiQ (UPF0313 family)
VFIVDDNFIGVEPEVTKKWLREIIKWQEAHHYPFKFMVQASVNMAEDEELVLLMVKANIVKTFFGFETPNHEILKSYKKTQNLKVNLPEIIEFFLNHGIEVLSGIMYGSPLDNKATCQYLLEFNLTGNVLIMPAILEALPGTPMWKEFEKDGKLLEANYGGSQSKIGLNFKHDNAEEIIRNYKRLIVEFYSITNFYKRLWKFLEQYKHKAVDQKTNFNELMAFLKSIVYIGILSKESKFYWKTIFIMLFNKEKRNAFAKAIEFMISGHKYFKPARKLKAQIT